MKVPLLDLKAQFATIRAATERAVLDVLESQHFINGPAVADLERQIAAYSGCQAGIGVSSGTDALLAALMALGIGAGDEVITTPYTFFATVGGIWRLGAKPVFVDIQADTFNIDTASVEAAITRRTRAIMPVHLFGQTADMDPLLAIAGKHQIPVIEDAAQAIGAEYKGRRAGAMGTLGCLSFFPSKNLGGMGDGGMVVTNDAALAESIRVLRNHGSNPKYFHRVVGGNFRLDTLQAAGLLVKLPHLEVWSAKRRANAARYDELLRGTPAVRTPTIRPENRSIFNQYVIRVPRRDALMAFLRDQGIGTEVYYPRCMHEQECFAALGYKKGAFPEAEKAAAESLALPIFAELTDEQIAYTASAINRFFA